MNPAFVNLGAHGGLGWLEGFDELLARCGLENNGAPFEVETVKPDGSKSHTTFGLHGRIANIPASYVAVHVDAAPPHEITIEGHVEETRVFGPADPHEDPHHDGAGLEPARRARRVREPQGPAALRCRCCTTGISGRRSWMPGRGFVAPIKSVTPRDATAAGGPGRLRRVRRPEAGLCRAGLLLRAARGDPAAGGKTLVMLRNHEGDKGVVLEFRTDQLPAFTLWKNTAGLRDGYVTGLEPGTNYPNPRPFEQARNRVVRLPVDGRYVTETTDDGARDALKPSPRPSRRSPAASPWRGQDQPASDRAVCA